MFLQIPVFFGLFAALRASFDLRHAPFAGWITDLSKPDHLLRIDWNLPLIGAIPYLNLLPLLMVVLWLGQQMTMPLPTDEQAARMQKRMRFMPVVFGLFLYDYAAGLSLYMITQSLLGILEQTAVKKMWPIDDTEQPKKEGGWFSRLQKRAVEMQKQQESRKRRLASSGKGSKKR
jgi:YidC/Oxa1 family membrane protein insertase